MTPLINPDIMKSLLRSVSFTLITLCLTLAASAKPLNVLFIAIDDLNDWVGVFGGHPQAKTPNMDKLAKSDGGIIFDMAYCPASVCGPSRSSLLSGIRPSNSGVYGNSNNMKLSPVLKDAETISQYFSRHGYHSLSAGKIFHKHPNWSGMDEGQWAFDEWAHPIGRHGIKESFPLNKLPMSDGSPAKSKGKEFDWGPTVNPFEKTSDYASAKWAADQISTRDFDGKPFFLALGISKPHLAWHVPQGFFDMHPLADVIVPEIHLDDLDDIIDAKGKKKFRPSEDFLRIQKYDKFKEVTQAYLAACSYADACIGVTLDALFKSQYKDNTIVVIWGDHGWFLGEKLKYRKTQLWEESNRVPLIIHLPNNKSASTHTEAIVNLIDLYPTLAEYCGLPPKVGLDGRSFSAVLRKPDTQWENPTLTTMGFKNHSLRGPRYRYTRYADGTEELYDHESDPMEWKNLATDPEMEAVMARFRPLLPKYDAPEMPKNAIDKKRMRRVLSKINGMSKALKEQSEANKLDPDFVKKIYAETR